MSAAETQPITQDASPALMAVRSSAWLARPYYEDASVKIYKGEACDVLRHFQTGIADVLLTDPPYSSGGMYRGDRTGSIVRKYNVVSGGGGNGVEETNFAGDTRDQRSWQTWVAAWMHECGRVVNPGGHAFVFSDWRQLPTATDAVQLGGWVWRGILVWDKTSTRPISGRFYQIAEFLTWATNGPYQQRSEETPHAIIRVKPVRGNDREHLTQKPVELLRHILGVVNDGKPITILDPFMGSGSTLVAAKQIGCKAIGIELDEMHCETAAKRCASELALGLAG
jgi:site-specific DNA-methyltransferase (adenine-specific)